MVVWWWWVQVLASKQKTWEWRQRQGGGVFEFGNSRAVGEGARVSTDTRHAGVGGTQNASFVNTVV